MTNQQQLIEAIEPLVDSTSLVDVLLALARMCNEKAEHLQCNWQDADGAKVWDRAARAIDRFTTHAAITTVQS